MTRNKYKRNQTAISLNMALKSVATFEAECLLARDPAQLWEALTPFMQLCGHALPKYIETQDQKEMERQYWNQLRCGGADYNAWVQPYAVTMAQQMELLQDSPYKWGMKPAGTRVMDLPGSSTSPYGRTREQCHGLMPKDDVIESPY
jgi:hypothetical protein